MHAVRTFYRLAVLIASPRSNGKTNEIGSKMEQCLKLLNSRLRSSDDMSPFCLARCYQPAKHFQQKSLLYYLDYLGVGLIFRYANFINHSNNTP
jgi:hypothetical protein